MTQDSGKPLPFKRCFAARHDFQSSRNPDENYRTLRFAEKLETEESEGRSRTTPNSGLMACGSAVITDQQA